MPLLLNIDVPDIAVAERFYVAAFGLQRGRRFGEDFVELLGWPAPVYLLQKPAGSPARAMSCGATAATGRRSIPMSWSRTSAPPWNGRRRRAR
jgi:hypothetical protein